MHILIIVIYPNKIWYQLNIKKLQPKIPQKKLQNFRRLPAVKL